MKKIGILGSTGSIGCNALNIVRHLPDNFEVVALAAKSNIELLEQQAKEFRPAIIGVYDRDKALELQKKVPECEVVAGMEGLIAAAQYSGVEQVILSIAGTLGLEPTIAAIQAGKDVALANKEALVSGGALVMDLVRKHKIKLIPVDSEHSAIFQCLEGERRSGVNRIILTASGGAFRTYSSEQLQKITVENALCHPNWSMGPKVTVDSSTLMNKGLEVIEAHWLFDIPIDQIEVVIHPQSIIHSMVEFKDYSILAQMGMPDMRTPIQYAMTYPKRMGGTLRPFDFVANNSLQFYRPDVNKFRCLDLAFQAIKKGGSLPCYMNAANEKLVNRFLNKQISWMDISKKLEILMEKHNVKADVTMHDVIAIDEQARQEAEYV